MKYKVYQAFSLISGCLIHFIFGSVGTIGTVTPYIASYLYYSGDTSIRVVDVSIIYPLVMVFQCLGVILSSREFFNKIPMKLVTLLALICFSLAVFLTSFMNAYWGYLLFYGCMFGFCIGISYLTPFKNTYSYFPNRKGMCGGFCMMGYGLSPLVFNQIFLSLVNPNNLHSDQRHFFPRQVADNLPFALRVLSAIYLGVGLLAILIFIPKNTKVYNPRKQEHQQTVIQQSLLQPVQKATESIIANIKGSQFWKIFILVLCTQPFGLFLAYNYKQYGQLVVNNDSMLTLIGSFGAFFNFIGRIFWGYLFDFKSFRFIMLLINGGLYLNCIFVFFIKKQQQILYMIAVCVNYFLYGAPFAIFPTQTVRIYGTQLGTRIYPFVFVSFTCVAVLQFLFHLLFVGLWGDAGFLYCLIIFLTIQAVGICLSTVFKFKYKDQKQTYSKSRYE